MAAVPLKPGAVVYQSDTLSLLQRLPSESCDFCYTNPPFGITNAKWDQALPWDALWPQIWRVLKPKGVVVLHCSMPFTYDLINHSENTCGIAMFGRRTTPLATYIKTTGL